MGFNMKNLTAQMALAILIPLFLFTVIGCMKKPDHTPNYGPEVTIDEIQKVALDSIPPDPSKIKLGQYISIDVTQVIDTQAPVTLSQKLDSVTKYDAVKDPLYVLMTFQVKMNELSNTGQWLTSVQEYDMALEKDRNIPLGLSAQGRNPSAQMGSYSLKALKKAEASSPVRVTYHNLKREEGFIPVPPLVKSRPDCGGVQNCERGLRYLRLSFDKVIWENDEGTKTSYRVVYSPDIPTYIADWSNPDGIYPTNQFQFCAQTWLKIQNGEQNQVVPVRQCADMRDFQFGRD
jgi:hypothetical protein